MQMLPGLLTDPSSIPLWLVFFFAAGMWPVGLLWCCLCCAQPENGCNCYDDDTPDTITLTVNGLPDCIRDSSPYTVAFISFSADFGVGAQAKVTSPTYTPGPLTGVELTSKGSGYAVFGRSAPDVTTAVTGGTGCSLVPSLSQSLDNAGDKIWSVASISVSQAGDDYPDSQEVSFEFEQGTQVDASAGAIAYGGRVAPTLEASVASAGGSGAALSVAITKDADANGRDVWRVDEIVVDDGGSGYEVNDFISISVSGDGQEVDAASGYVESVGSSGEIEVAAVSLLGEFFEPTGQIASVDVYDGGAFYASDPNVAPKVADVVVTVTQTGDQAPYASGAKVSAKVDSDTKSATFGQIASISIDNGGTGYVAYVSEVVSSPSEGVDGIPFVMRRADLFPSWDDPFYNKPELALYANAGFPPPTLSLSVESESGNGACLETGGRPLFQAAELSRISRDSSGSTWQVDAVRIVRGGTGYEVGDAVVFDVARFGTIVTAPQAEVSSVSAGGAITGVTVIEGGEIYRGASSCFYWYEDCKILATARIAKKDPLAVFVPFDGEPASFNFVYASMNGYSLTGEGLASCESFSASLSGVAEEGTPYESALTGTITSGGTYTETGFRKTLFANCDCCWSDPGGPEEVEIEWHVDDGNGGFDYVGNFFLPGQNPGWSLQHSAFNGARLFVRTVPCHDPQQPGCNTCGTRCKTTVNLYAVRQGVPCYLYTSTHADCDESCVDAELCAPQAGEYVLEALDPAGNVVTCDLPVGKVVILS